jgi:hypothetical protein
MPSALTITEDGTATIVEFPTDGDSLSFLQHHVGGNVDVVSLSSYLDMWVGDESLFTHGPNAVATAIAHTFGFDAQLYHGPVVFTGGVDDDGNTLPLVDGLAPLMAQTVIELGGIVAVEPSP